MAHFNDGNTNGFQKGGNDGRRTSSGTRKPRKPRSVLRKLEAKLEEDLDLALSNVKNNIKGQEVDKDVLASSKWLVEKYITTVNNAVAEEQKKVAIRKSLDEKEILAMEEEDELEASKPSGAKFSLHVIDTKKD